MATSRGAARCDAAGPLRQALSDVTGLLLPVVCAGCGTWDDPLCPACQPLLRARPRRCEADAPVLAGLSSAAALPTWCLAEYAGAVRGIVLAWKGHGDRVVAAAVRRAGRAAGLAWWAELSGDGHVLDDGDVVVVPAPSGWRRRASGRLVVRTLASEVARGLTAAVTAEQGWPAAEPARHGVLGRSVTMTDVLRRAYGRAHQAGLGAAGRSANRRRSMRLIAGLPPRSSCLLVDDVLTTGATLGECRRVLESAGHRVLGALVLAATPSAGVVPGAGSGGR